MVAKEWLYRFEKNLSLFIFIHHIAQCTAWAFFNLINYLFSFSLLNIYEGPPVFVRRPRVEESGGPRVSGTEGAMFFRSSVWPGYLEEWRRLSRDVVPGSCNGGRHVGR